jgi:hypothetical protein
VSRPARILFFFPVVALLAASAGCGRTALSGICPEGYSLESGECQCVTDEGCPAGYVCNAGTCECRSDGCCPAGYKYSQDSQACVCHDTACCPKEYVWKDAAQECDCGSQICCPGGYVFDDVAQGCRCAADQCCPVGFLYDAVAKQCTCHDDSCCPVDYHWDENRASCVCAKDSCCPANYAYNASVRACVCVGDTCCPAGFKQDPVAKRCVCDPAQAATACGDPAHTFCDNPGSGACKCLDNQGCKAGNYCNGLGFCQSAAACTSNIDCPAGSFCDVLTSTCIPAGPCVIDAECPSGDVCLNGTCTSGCYVTSDCPITPPTPQQSKPSCVGSNLGVSPAVLGSCQPFCLINNSCPVNQFCNAATGGCAIDAADTDCLTCNTNQDCGANGNCLTFISEGQQQSFCGTTCTTDDQCPSGFNCGGVIFGCAPGAGCPQPGGTPVSCVLFNPVNDVPQYFCAGPDGNPYVYFNACAPLSGTCPAVPFP